MLKEKTLDIIHYRTYFLAQWGACILSDKKELNAPSVFACTEFIFYILVVDMKNKSIF